MCLITFAYPYDFTPQPQLNLLPHHPIHHIQTSPHLLLIPLPHPQLVPLIRYLILLCLTKQLFLLVQIKGCLVLGDHGQDDGGVDNLGQVVLDWVEDVHGE
jgi:hypothetical protein